MTIRRACIHPTCPGYAVDGGSACPEHRRSNWERYKPAHADIYRTRRWTDLRARVLREEPVCAEPGCNERSTSVDHIVSLGNGGVPYDRSNLRGLCFPHHQKRSSQQGAEARKRKRAETRKGHPHE